MAQTGFAHVAATHGALTLALQPWSEHSKAMTQVVGALSRQAEYSGVDFARVDLETSAVRVVSRGTRSLTDVASRPVLAGDGR